MDASSDGLTPPWQRWTPMWGACAFLFCVLLLAPETRVWAQTRADFQSPVLQPQVDLRTPPSPLQLLAPANLGRDAFRVVSAPFRMSSQQYLRLVGFAGVTAGLVSALDGPLYQQFHGTPGTPLHNVPRYLAGPGQWYDRLGPTRVALGTAGAFALGGLLLEDNRHLRTSIRVVEAVVFTQILTGVMKQVVGRARPFTGHGPDHADLFELEFSNGHPERSMPSGHTSKAFAIASVIAHQYDTWWVKAPAYATAASVGIQRIRSGKHWFSDVVVGATLGYFIGATLTADTPKRDGGIAYDPIVSFRSVGLSLRF